MIEGMSGYASFAFVVQANVAFLTCSFLLLLWYYFCFLCFCHLCRLARSLFQEHFHVRHRGSGPCFHDEPKTQQDPAWSPVVEIKHVQVNTERGMEPPTTTALIVVHRLAFQDGEEIVMGRFLLPVRRGLYEVIAIAGDGGLEWGSSTDAESTPSPISAEPLRGLQRNDRPAFPSTSSSTPAPLLSSTAPNTPPDSFKTTIDNSHPLIVESNVKRKSAVRTLDMDGSEYDDKFPNHCLSRVRRAMNWLTHKSCMVVTELPLPTPPPGSEMELSHLRCRIVPPPRFLYCPNPYNPESNKYRFCRATLGGTDGVEMMVVSAWYTERDIGKGIKPLRKVAHHAAKVIHASQLLFHIRIDIQEIVLQVPVSGNSSNTTASKNSAGLRWILPGTARRTSSQDAIIAVVNCTDAQGMRKQNTIGFIREASTGQVYLVYFADTIAMDHATVMREISETLSSIRKPRSMSKGVRRNLEWHAPPVPLESS